MVIGHGDIASVLPERDDVIFFASGVSNSNETRSSEFQREIALLSQQDRTKRIVYFSSLAVFGAGDTRYINHKRTMEDVIKKFYKRYCIVRVGNIDWGSNPNTLINYLRTHPEAPILDEYRYVVDKDEFLHWISLIPNWNCEMNVPGRRLKVKEIYEQYVTDHTKQV